VDNIMSKTWMDHEMQRDYWDYLLKVDHGKNVPDPLKDPKTRKEYEDWLAYLNSLAIKCPSCDEVRVVDGVCGDCGYVEPERRS
jgi:ribosomal protein L32